MEQLGSSLEIHIYDCVIEELQGFQAAQIVLCHRDATLSLWVHNDGTIVGTAPSKAHSQTKEKSWRKKNMDCWDYWNHGKEVITSNASSNDVMSYISTNRRWPDNDIGSVGVAVVWAAWQGVVA